MLSRLTLGPEVGFTEFVEVHVDFDHPSFLDLEVELHSPTGTVSKLAVPNEDARDRKLQTTFRFGSARHLGEDPSGEWTLMLTDRVAEQEGSIRWWGIKVYGHGEGASTQKTSNSPATGAPGISGRVRVGDTLSADVSSVDDWDGLSGAAFSYQWIRNDRTADTDTDIPGATEATYTLVADDEGHTVKVRVTFTDDAGSAETLTSAHTEPVLGPNTPATGLPTISGTARVGETLTANTSGIADENGLENITFTYQWLADDTAIDGATGSAHTLADADQGKSIKVRVSFTDDGGNEETLTSTPTGLVLGDGPPGAPGKLTITAGDRELTLSWAPPDDNGNAPAKTYRVEWKKEGQDYNESQWAVVSKTTYTKTHLANGISYTFRVKAKKGNGYGPPSEEVSGTPTSGSAVDLDTPVLSEPEPLHHGMVKLDWEDIADAGWYEVHYYQINQGSGDWLDLPAVGVDVALYGSSAVVSNLDGLSWLRVRAVSCAGASEWSGIEQFGTRASDWEDIPVPALEAGDEIEPCPVDLGTPVLSKPEALHHGMVKLDWEDIEDAGWYEVQYYHIDQGSVEWLDLPAVGVDVALYGSSAVVSNLDGLSWLRVRAVSCAGASEWSEIEQFGTRASDWEGVPVPTVEAGDETESCTEDLDTPVPSEPDGDNSPATGAPTITGTAQVGETLTSGIKDADGLTNAAFTYQWLADDGTTDSDITDATSSTYALVAADEGKTVKVRVSFTDDVDNGETLTSGATDAVAALGALAQQLCSGGGYDPTPTAVAVTSIPIVVTSTTDDYFVLYVSHDVDGTEVDLPVLLKKGEACTTTLAENIEALPAERYRVEKYLIADPADVGGDDIDDITEFDSLGSMNPLNRAAKIQFHHGTVAIPDRETFEQLSYQGNAVLIDRHLADLEFVKFFLYYTNTDRPAVHFMNTVTHRAHGNFINATGWFPLVWAMLGEIVYHPNVVAPDGSLGVYRFEFEPGDAYSFARVQYAYDVLAASMPLLENNLAYYPMPARALPKYRREQALYDNSRVNVLLEEDILPDVDFISLNQGTGYGLLRVMSREERPNPRDVVIYESLPNDLPRVAGIITTVPQTPLSHVNLRALQDRIPNAFIRDALDDETIDSLIDSHVHYTVTQDGYTIRAATRAEVDAHYDASRPSAEQTPQRDLSVTEITPLSEVGFEDWTAFGVKAANVAVLGTLGFPDGLNGVTFSHQWVAK